MSSQKLPAKNDIEKLFYRWNKSVVKSTSHRTFGHNSVTLEVSTDKGIFILRTNENGDVYAKTEKNIHTLSSLGIPVAKVLVCEINPPDFPFSYMIMEYLPGQDLRFAIGDMSATEQRLVASQVIDAQAKVSALPTGEGYGYVSIGERGPFDSWRDLVWHTFESTTGKELAGEGQVQKIETLLQRAGPVLGEVPPTCFLDDLTVKNVMVDKGRLTGFVDFDCVCYGDMGFQIALTQTGLAADLPELSTNYISYLFDFASFSPLRRSLTHLYSAVFALDFLGYYPSELYRLHMQHQIDRWTQAAQEIIK